MKKRKTNHEKIMDALRKGHVLTSLTAAKMLGITNLPSEIGEMVYKDRAWHIKSCLLNVGEHYMFVDHKKITKDGKSFNAYWIPFYVKLSEKRKYGL